MSEELPVSKLNEMASEIHVRRHEQGLVTMHSFLLDLEKGCMKAMAAGTKETFDHYQGQQKVLSRLIKTIENGPAKPVTPTRYVE